MTFVGMKHNESSNKKRSDTIKAMYKNNRPTNMGFSKKYNTEEEAKLAQRVNNRTRQLKCRYGLTIQDYDDMLNKQKGVCAICETDEAIPNTGYRLHVDHNHTTGKVRGLLCTKCNKALGFVENTNIQKLFEYFKLHEPDVWNAFALMYYEDNKPELDDLFNK